MFKFLVRQKMATFTQLINVNLLIILLILMLYMYNEKLNSLYFLESL